MEKLLKWLKKQQPFWDLLHRAGRLLPLSFFRGLPKVIKFESTNVCNLRCPVCPTHFAITREKGFLDFPLFKGVIDELKSQPKKPKIAFSMSGEPLLNREMAGFIGYAHRNGHETYISTNVTRLDRQLSKQLIVNGLSAIHLAIDGISQKSHEAYRIGSDFFRVKGNIEAFLRMKEELGSPTPRVVIQTLLTSFSEGEIQDIVDWAAGIGADSVAFKSMSPGSYGDRERRGKYAYLLPKEKKFLRKVSRVQKRLCRLPIEEAVIYWNGDLGLCCVDFDSACRLPNIEEKGFLAAWKSKEVRLTRKKGFLKKNELCRTCSLGNADYGGFSVPLAGNGKPPHPAKW